MDAPEQNILFFGRRLDFVQAVLKLLALGRVAQNEMERQAGRAAHKSGQRQIVVRDVQIERLTADDAGQIAERLRLLPGGLGQGVRAEKIVACGDDQAVCAGRHRAFGLCQRPRRA